MQRMSSARSRARKKASTSLAASGTKRPRSSFTHRLRRQRKQRKTARKGGMPTPTTSGVTQMVPSLVLPLGALAWTASGDSPRFEVHGTRASRAHGVGSQHSSGTGHSYDGRHQRAPAHAAPEVRVGSN